MTQAVCILGVTGSIGQSTLKVLEQHPDQYTVFAVSAYSRLDELLEICKKYHPKIVVVPNEKAFEIKQTVNDAFEYIIEEIKKRSPIWKKEHYENEESEWLKGNPIQAN